METKRVQYYNEVLKEKVWAKGKKVRGKNPNLYRKDKFNSVIFKTSYGKRTSMGWEIDHSVPLKKGGTNTLRNLQPLHWLNNRLKGTKYPYKPSRKNRG